VPCNLDQLSGGFHNLAFREGKHKAASTAIVNGSHDTQILFLVRIVIENIELNVVCRARWAFSLHRLRAINGSNKLCVAPTRERCELLIENALRFRFVHRGISSNENKLSHGSGRRKWQRVESY